MAPPSHAMRPNHLITVLRWIAQERPSCVLHRETALQNGADKSGGGFGCSDSLVSGIGSKDQRVSSSLPSVLSPILNFLTQLSTP